MKAYTKEQILAAAKEGEVNKHDAKHICVMLEEMFPEPQQPPAGEWDDGFYVSHNIILGEVRELEDHYSATIWRITLPFKTEAKAKEWIEKQWIKTWKRLNT